MTRLYEYDLLYFPVNLPPVNESYWERSGAVSCPGGDGVLLLRAGLCSELLESLWDSSDPGQKRVTFAQVSVAWLSSEAYVKLKLE